MWGEMGEVGWDAERKAPMTDAHVVPAHLGSDKALGAPHGDFVGPKCPWGWGSQPPFPKQSGLEASSIWKWIRSKFSSSEQWRIRWISLLQMRPEAAFLGVLRNIRVTTEKKKADGSRDFKTKRKHSDDPKAWFIKGRAICSAPDVRGRLLSFRG